MTQDDLEKLAESCLKNLKEFKDCEIEYDKKLFSFYISLKGEKFNSSITTPVMEYFLAVQKGIYALYKQYTSRNPTREERKRLQLVVRVDKGSSKILYSILDQLGVIKEAVQNMTGDQAFAAIVIGISAFTIVSLGKRIFDHIDKKHAQNIELQKEKARNDKDKAVITAFSETINTVSQLRKDMMKSLGNIEDGTLLTYSGSTISLKELKERVSAERDQKEPEISTITGSYRIRKLYFNFETSSAKADIFNINTNELLNAVEIQPRSILDGTFKVLKKAQDKEDINLQLIVRKKNDKILKTTLDKIL